MEFKKKKKKNFSITISRDTYDKLKEKQILLYYRLRENGDLRNVGFDKVISDLLINSE